jgi:hypothetical protein
MFLVPCSASVSVDHKENQEKTNVQEKEIDDLKEEVKRLREVVANVNLMTSSQSQRFSLSLSFFCSVALPLVFSVLFSFACCCCCCCCLFSCSHWFSLLFCLVFFQSSLAVFPCSAADEPRRYRVGDIWKNIQSSNYKTAFDASLSLFPVETATYLASAALLVGNGYVKVFVPWRNI